MLLAGFLHRTKTFFQFLPLFFLLLINNNKVQASDIAKIDTNQVNELNATAWKLKNRNPDSAIFIAKKALQLATSIHFYTGKATAYNTIGIALLTKGNFDESLEYHKLSLTIYDSIGDKRGVSNSLTNIGNIYKERGYYDEAFHLYLKSLQIKEETGNKRGMASSYMNIGNVLLVQRKFRLAREYYLKGLVIYNEFNDKNGIALSLNNIGNIYYYESNFTEALDYFTKALTILKELNNKASIASCLNNLGSIHMELKNYKLAEHYLQEALKIYDEFDDKNGKAIIFYNLGQIAYYKQQYHETVKNCENAKKLCIITGNVETLRDVYYLLSQTYVKIKNYQEAYANYRSYFIVHDSIFSKDRARKLDELQTKYETEKKEKEIKLLTKEKELKSVELTKKQQSLWFLLVCFILTSVLAIISFYSFYQKKKSNYYLKLRNFEIEQQKEEIMAQRDEIERKSEILNEAYQIINQKNKSITDSIVYAQGIQKALLPNRAFLQSVFDEYCLFFAPKDIVSGDFYWVYKQHGIIFTAIVDCTGHGVPGAMMSVIGVNLLNQAVKEHNLTQPNEILNFISCSLTETLQQNFEEYTYRDGMDVSLVSFNKDKMQLGFAGACNSIQILSNNTITEYKGDIHPIGSVFTNNFGSYNMTTLDLKHNDKVFLYTDGYFDQFGGDNKTKYTKNKFKNLIIEHSHLSLSLMEKEIENSFYNWKGNNEQIDDALVFGFKV